MSLSKLGISSFNIAIKSLIKADHLSVSHAPDRDGQIVRAEWFISSRELYVNGNNEKRLWDYICKRVGSLPASQREEELLQKVIELQSEVVRLQMIPEPSFLLTDEDIKTQVKAFKLVM